jgi:hypothetical protein
MTVFLIIVAVHVIATLVLRGTTHYIVESDRLLIKRAGSIWMEIPFRDVEEIQHQAISISRFSEIRLYQLGIRKMFRIKKKRGFRYVLINPRSPAAIIEAYDRFRHWPANRPP